MEGIREVKKSFCILSAAYLVLGLVLLIWPDISVRTFCYVFGVGMIIFGGAHLIIYFTKDKLQSVMQPDMVVGVVGVATGAYILLKMEYMLEIIPFAMGIVALLGAIVKLQNAFDLRRVGAVRWYIMLVWALVLFLLGVMLVANPFEKLDTVVFLLGGALIVDGVGNLVGIFWMGHALKRLNRMPAQEQSSDIVDISSRKRKKKKKEETAAAVEVPFNETAEEQTEYQPPVPAEEISNHSTEEQGEE